LLELVVALEGYLVLRRRLATAARFRLLLRFLIIFLLIHLSLGRLIISAAGELVDSAGIVTSPTAAIGDFLMGYASRVVSFLLVITEVTDGLWLPASLGIAAGGAAAGGGPAVGVGGAGGRVFPCVRVVTE